MKFNAVLFLEELCREGHIGSRTELPDRIADWPEPWREEYEERAAIMEFDGMLSRQQAEQWAETIVRAAYRLNHKNQNM